MRSHPTLWPLQRRHRFDALSSTTPITIRACGKSALQSNATGDENTAWVLLRLKTTAAGATTRLLGLERSLATTLADNNTADREASAPFNNETGNNNTATGFQALLNNNAENNNTASGSNSLQSNTTGSNNTANGLSALFSNSTGNNNTASGSVRLGPT